MSFLVHSAGTNSILVDLGRPHHRGLGVPVGGAADRGAFILGSALAGNTPSRPALEITLAGPTLEATADHGCVLFGAPFQIHVNDRLQPPGKTFCVRKGDLITISTTPRGLRAYFCVPGGFEAGVSLGSRSAWQPLKNGEVLECASGRLGLRALAQRDSLPADMDLLRVVPGSHATLFDQAQFAGQKYTVTPESNRMGLRLSGQPLPRPKGELLSSPVCPGTVQVTHSGLPIVLGVEAQTIGGYPRIAHVISADLDKLGQLPPGARVSFKPIDLAAARTLWRERQAWVHEWATRLRVSFA